MITASLALTLTKRLDVAHLATINVELISNKLTYVLKRS